MISIITVVFNDSEGFNKTVNSVREQKSFYQDIEFIVVDGGSVDDTLNVLKANEDVIDVWISEDDAGIYDAMNKGIDLSRGSFLLFLNAGDVFCGNVLGGFDNLQESCFLKVKYRNVKGRLVDRKIFSEKYTIPNCHQGIVFPKSKVRYDLNFDISADYKYYLEQNFFKAPVMLKSTGYVVFDSSGISSRNFKERDLQTYRIRKQFFGSFVAAFYEIRPFVKRILRATFFKKAGG